MKKVELKCHDIDCSSGAGICKYQGKNITVPYLLPKEVGVVEIDEARSYNKYKLNRVLKPASNRIDPGCGIYNRCGSCHLLHMNYDSQINLKKDYVIKCLKENKIDSKINEVVTATTKEGYRNKMQVAYKMRDGEMIYGFYEEESHKVIPLKFCKVHTKKQNEICKSILDVMKQMKIAPYNEDKRTGIIRFVVVREAFKTNEILVTIVTNSEIFPGRSEFVKRLVSKCPYITTIIQNINKRKTSIILGDDEKLLYGKGFISESICNIDFKISSKTFFQVNPEATEKLYNKVLEYANLTGKEIVIDAYCGVGTIGMVLSSKAKEVYGVEVNKQSVINARQNAYDNKIKNIKFVCDDATEYLFELSKEKVDIDLVVMDPPRSGSTEKFIDSLCKLKPKKIIYISCEASTLARDLNYLFKKCKDYEIKEKTIVDMFVGTYHVETLVCLSKKTEKHI